MNLTYFALSIITVQTNNTNLWEYNIPVWNAPRKKGTSMTYFLSKKTKSSLATESRIVARPINLVAMEIYLPEYNFTYQMLNIRNIDTIV